ncbi:MAG: hypothetical protein HY381_00280 [Candidatus Chisholmbacteria bacterium]|nr:hypothetical protein [Candidatus Chisholmbacteria bacterium]
MVTKVSQTFPLLPLLLIGAVIFILVSQIDTVRTLLTRARGEPADIKVDTQAIIGPLPRVWRNLAQGGETGGLNLAPLLSQLTPLHPEYIRIDHLYDFYVTVNRDDTGNLTFDWTKLDQLLASLTALGSKPFISLSYMPAVLSDDIVGPPANWSDWASVVRSTMEHISGRAGLNLTDVYYEVWNEPDLFGQWKTYGDKNYLTLYSYAAAGARQAQNVQAFKFGGPAITAFYPGWAKALFNFVLTNQIRLDFFSWHRYHRDLDQYLEDVGDLNLILEDYPNLAITLEKIITESGHDSDIDPGYDSLYSAAHTLALTRTLTGLIDKLFTFEIQDGQDPNGQAFWGRWGLFTHDSFGSTPKPRFFALSLLEQLSSDRLSLAGEGTWVKGLAAQQGESTQVLLVNYDPRGQHSENVPVTFTSLSSSSFTLSESFLLGRQRQLSLATSAAELRHSLFMPANSAALLTLTPTSP